MDRDQLRTIALAELEDVRIAAVILRAESFSKSYHAAQRIFKELPGNEHMKVDGQWLEFYAYSIHIMDLRDLKVWGLRGASFRNRQELTSFTGRFKILDPDSVHSMRIRMRYS